ncbi:MmcQ/YjbR family DNA-binding protein [Kibdelosporangium philippinense]|uniref:MmcQ/YjbR family DNA-binding protein n=1 Tax=Kibdelosporangium philippinense TaxID=211113 RepID=A0ABS8Z7C0_9PSEU|nr:MmcQ/YjbR family DNA-binding protein [Kibdelosporangium philippinense]MCE7001722.1 MmcQ/YjbR family DNA-binding protein [Kibdelosporangium philippinense]
MVTVEEIREVASALPRAYEVVVYDRIKFRVGQIVFVALSRDETTMGFGFPKELRDSLIEAEPAKFFPPSKSDARFNWVQVHLNAIDADEMRDLVTDAWRMCVPKKVAASYDAQL